MTGCGYAVDGQPCGQPSRPYICGDRCAAHAPWALAGHDEPASTARRTRRIVHVDSMRARDWRRVKTVLPRVTASPTPADIAAGEWVQLPDGRWRSPKGRVYTAGGRAAIVANGRAAARRARRAS